MTVIEDFNTFRRKRGCNILVPPNSSSEMCKYCFVYYQKYRDNPCDLGHTEEEGE